MNKYEQAYDDCASGRFGSSHWDLIKQLVERATPKKTGNRYYSMHEATYPEKNGWYPYCIKCKKELTGKNEYCPNCGQALKWSEEE